MNTGQSGAGYSPVIFYNRPPFGYHSQQNPSDFPRCNHNPYVADDLTKRAVHNIKEQSLDQVFLGPEQLTTHTWQVSEEPGIEQHPGTLDYDGYLEKPIRSIHHNHPSWTCDPSLIEHFDGHRKPDNKKMFGCVVILLLLFLFAFK